MITRDEAFELVGRKVSKRNVVYHMLAVEAIMRSVAKHLGEDVDKWALTGLLHDIDFEKTEATPEKHSLLAEEMLKGLVSDDVMRAVKAHNFIHTHVMPEAKMEKALIASDAVSGLLIACALVMPSRKLAEVKADSVARKYRDKDFARGAERNRIIVCEDIGIPKDEFLEIALHGLQEAAARIGL